MEIIAWVNKKSSESEDTASSINLQAFDLSKLDVITNLIHSVMPGAISFGNVACGRMEEVKEEIPHYHHPHSWIHG